MSQYSQFQSTQPYMSQMSQEPEDFESAAGNSQVEKDNREDRDNETDDAALFLYPKSAKDYKDMEYNLVNDYFDKDDCIKIVRTLDILHSTLAKCLKDKKNIKITSFITSLKQNRTLINYLNEKVRINEDALLHKALFDESGNGIIIWVDDDKSFKLAQLVNPKHNETQRLEDSKTKARKLKKSIEKKFVSGDLTRDANDWMLEDDKSKSSSSSNGAAGSIEESREFKNITIKDFLKRSVHEYDIEKTLIFDLITKTKEGVMKFSLRAGEINISEGNEDAVIFVNDRKPHNPIFNLNNHKSLYPEFFHQVRYLPFFQAYNRDLKAGNYKTHGNLERQENWLVENPGGALTPIINKKMHCALCGLELVKKKTGYIFDVDHVWNLILNSLLRILDSPEGYFDTHGTCNRNFKSDRVFIPNYNVWVNLCLRGNMGLDPNAWPGKKFGMAGISNKPPPGGYRTFNIGYLDPRRREEAYNLLPNALPGDNKKRVHVLEILKQNEALNHKDIDPNWEGFRFNEFDLQLKFLKRTLLIAKKDKLQLDSKENNEIVDNLVKAFDNEIEILLAAAENVAVFENLSNGNYDKIPGSVKQLLDSVKHLGHSAQEKMEERIINQTKQTHSMIRQASTDAGSMDNSKDNPETLSHIRLVNDVEELKQTALYLQNMAAPENKEKRLKITIDKVGRIYETASVLSSELDKEHKRIQNEEEDKGGEKTEREKNNRKKKKYVVNIKNFLKTIENIKSTTDLHNFSVLSSASSSPPKQISSLRSSQRAVRFGSQIRTPQGSPQGSPEGRKEKKMSPASAKTPQIKSRALRRLSPVESSSLSSSSAAGAAGAAGAATAMGTKRERSDEEAGGAGYQQKAAEKKRRKGGGTKRKRRKKKKKKKTKRRNKKRRKKTKRKRKRRKRTRRKR